jgi:hypothetical protein
VRQFLLSGVPVGVTMRKASPQWVAERILLEGSRRSRRSRVTVRLGRPEKVADLEWRSVVEILRGKTRKTLFVHGIDPFQSLILAIEVIGYELDKGRRQISWEGGEPGETGFPVHIPDLFGRRFSLKLQRMIELEKERLLLTGRQRRRR